MTNVKLFHGRIDKEKRQAMHNRQPTLNSIGYRDLVAMITVPEIVVFCISTDAITSSEQNLLEPAGEGC